MELKTEIMLVQELKKVGTLKKGYYLLIGVVLGSAGTMLFAMSAINRLLDASLK